MAGRAPTGLDVWLQRIRDAEMPIFGRTAERIRYITDSDRAGVAELSAAILEDPGMTAKLLRIANSVIFNTSGQHVPTVSRTVLLLGFNMVRDVAITVAFVDSFLYGKAKERALREMARSFHTAVQARWMARRRHDGVPEEVFIAALLYRLGEIAFWCFAGETGARLDETMGNSAGGAAAAEAEQAALGFRLRQLTRALLREWHISPLLQSVLEGGYPRRTREHALVLAVRLAEALEGGPNSERALKLVKEVADMLQMPEDEVLSAVLTNSAQAARVAEEFGLPAVSRHLSRRLEEH